jgi:hypothetical protein
MMAKRFVVYGTTICKHKDGDGLFDDWKTAHKKAIENAERDLQEAKDNLQAAKQRVGECNLRLEEVKAYFAGDE